MINEVAYPYLFDSLEKILISKVALYLQRYDYPTLIEKHNAECGTGELIVMKLDAERELQYFDKFFSQELLAQANEVVRAQKSMSKYHYNHFILESINQATTHHPDLRLITLAQRFNAHQFKTRNSSTYQFINAVYFESVVRIYATHFHLYEQFARSLSSPPYSSQLFCTHEYYYFNKFMLGFSTLHSRPSIFYNDMKIHLGNFESEVSRNCQELPNTKIAFYLDGLNTELNNYEKDCDKEFDVKIFFVKYKTDENELHNIHSNRNRLFDILNTEDLSKLAKDDDHLSHLSLVQIEFRKYYTLMFVSKALACIENKLKLCSEVSSSSLIAHPPANSEWLNVSDKAQNNASFLYTNLKKEPGNISDLYNALLKSNLIHAGTNKDDFKAVFSGKSIERKIVWTAKINLLHYFIFKLTTPPAKVVDEKNDHWLKAASIFLDINGNALGRDQLRKSQKPARSRQLLIDKIIRCL